MLRDGIYRALIAGSAETGSAVYVCRAGKVVGVGYKGADYEGTYSWDDVRKVNTFEIEVTFPPGVQMVTGMVAGAQGATLTVRGEGKTPEPVSRFSLDLAGRAVDVQLSYVRPLP
jgi:hypothetical protein